MLKLGIQSVLLCVGLIGLTNNVAANAQQKSEKASSYMAQLVTKGIDIPWGMAWLDPQSILVTDRKGELRLIKNGVLSETKISGLPEIVAKGQGGLLDVIVDPNFAQNQLIYFSYSGTEGEGEGASISVMRAKLSGFSLAEQKVIFEASPNTTSGHHFGSRLAFNTQGELFISVGDRGERDVNPQRLDRDAGKIHRIHTDGTIPKDNPFVGQAKANASIYSYGHRNPQGMALHPLTGDIWTHEHGPRGGDEVNIIKKAANYGWPVVSYGVNYSGTSFTDLTEKPGMEPPVWYWVPSIAPSGMTFVTSEKYPNWQGKLLVGSLKFAYLELLKLDGNKVTDKEVVLENIGRVRNVKQGLDGYLYVATDGAGIFKLVPNI
ncbi:PQQ-dependent sugar dehydrogenase [Paraglaciecola aestuariivivens]